MNILKIKNALMHGSSDNIGSHDLFSEGKDPYKWKDIKENEYFKEMLGEVLKEAEKFTNKPITVIPYSIYRIFDESGSRKEFELAYFERRARLNVFAILSMVYDNAGYLKELEDVIWAICDEYSWAHPSHMYGKSTAVHYAGTMSTDLSGKLAEKSSSQAREIDLFSAETAFTLSEVLHMLDGKLAPLVVYRARNEVMERVLKTYCDLNSSFWWETCTNNWAAVCAGSIGAAALYLIKEEELLARVLVKVLSTLECFLEGFSNDGACTEGLGYWNYGFGFYAYFSELLKQRTAGSIDLMKDQKIKQIALFQQKCYLSQDKVISFSDGFETFRFQPGLTHYLKGLFDEVEVPDIRYRTRFSDDHCYRWAPAIRNFVWNNSEIAGGSWKNVSYYMSDAQWFSSRYVDVDLTVCFAAKGGHNAEPHNHNDIGSFLFHVNGQTFLTDMGCGEYNKGYFGSGRYNIFCNGSQGHSVPIVEGCYQQYGEEYRARVIDVHNNEDSDIFILDIAKAYKSNNITSLIRTFTFEKRAEAQLMIKDEYKFIKPPLSITERFITFYKPEHIDEGVVEINGTNAGVHMLFDPDVLACDIQKNIFVNHSGVEEDVYTIDLEMKKQQLEPCFSIVFKVKDK